jgi:hypothetical protein
METTIGNQGHSFRPFGASLLELRTLLSQLKLVSLGLDRVYSISPQLASDLKRK